jgi:ribonuclease HI
LAYNLNHGVRWYAGNSGKHDNSRDIWKIIWKENVPKKVKIFGWRVACDNLPTKRNKKKRTLEIDSTCSICGREEEDSYHATVSCTKSRALRHEMRKHWQLPPEHEFKYSGPDWLQNLLFNIQKPQRSKVLMLLWRAWHLRCDICHDKGEETIARSVAFLIGYNNFLQEPNNRRHSNTGCTNDAPLTTNDSMCSKDVSYRKEQYKRVKWAKPDNGSIKINVDAGFCPKSKESTAGVVVRDHLGSVILAASMVGNNCFGAEEAEAKAICEGLKLAVEHNLSPNTLESDCLDAVTTINSSTQSSSRIWHIYKDISMWRNVLPNCDITYVGRNCNGVAHDLARLARKNGCSNVWLSPVPVSIREICNQDSVTDTLRAD